MRLYQSLVFIGILLSWMCQPASSPSPEPVFQDSPVSASPQVQTPAAPQSPKPVPADSLVHLLGRVEAEVFLQHLPPSGIIISPDPYIDTLRGDPRIGPTTNPDSLLFWGLHPARGDSIVMSFRDFYKRYLAQPFYQGVRHDKPYCQSTMAFNAEEVLGPHIRVIEYCLNPPTKENQMGWQALRLITDSSGYLLAIVRDYWTP